MTGSQTATRLAVVAGLMLVVGACSSVPRGVGSQPAKLVLTFANLLDQHSELQAIADTVERSSAGSMRIEFDDMVHKDRGPNTESAIVDDVVSGRYDLAWVAQRPWPERGIHAFDALVTPLLIDTYALEGAVLADPIADDMLAALDGSGVVGLGIVPGPIRYAAARDKPVLDLAALHGKTVAIDDTAVAVEALDSLGAKTTRMTLGGADLSGADVVIQQLGSIRGNRYDLEMPKVSGLGLWPRPVIVIIGKPLFDRLSSDQRAWLAQGIDAAVTDQLVALPTADVDAIGSMCENGTTITSPTADQRRASASAIQPAYDRLGKDPFTARAIARIEELKSASAPAQALPPCDLGSKPAPSNATGVGFPDGTYSAPASCDELQAFWESHQTPTDLRGGECPERHEFTLKDGKWTEWYGERWTYAFVGDHVRLGDFTLRWTYDGNQVTFSEIEGGRPDDEVVWTMKPFVRVDDPTPTSVAGFPEGRYVAEVSAEEQQAAWERFNVPLEEREVCPCKHEFTLADGHSTGADGHLSKVSFAGDHATIVDEHVTMTVRWTYDPKTRELTLSEPVGGFPGDHVVCCSEPFIKQE